MQYGFVVKDPDTAYITNNLLLPRSGVRSAPIKAALTFVYGEEEIIDPETNVLLGTRPKRLKLWDETGSHLIVPREFIPPSKYHNFRFPFVDLTPLHYPLTRIDDRIVFRDGDQKEAFDVLISSHSGTLNLACGRGKTVLALKLAAQLGVPTLIVVNTSLLMEQWLEEIEEHLGVKDVGIVQGDASDWEHPIALAMVHTLSLRRGEWSMKFRRHFGLVIYDEGHHMSAPVFVQSADLFFGRRFSLTATASRLDGLESIYQSHLGGVVFSDLRQDLIPMTIFHKLKWTFDKKRDQEHIVDKFGDVHLSCIRSYLGTLDWRNELIYEHALADLEEGRKILILTHSRDHVATLGEKLERIPGVQVGIIHGKTKKGTRIQTLRENNPVVGTFHLAREALNKPELDTLYVTTPFSSPNDLQQAWGRIQRKFKGKLDTLVRVFDDQAIDRCKKMGRSLRAALKKNNYPFKQEVVEVEV
jgi:superfamily II DNA or RNA helicase